MARPIVGVIGNALLVENRFQVQMTGERNLRAVADVTGALPLIFAGSPDITDIHSLLDVVDGVLLTGARANVHPTRFSTEPHPAHEPYDEARDAMALALTELCVARGVPIFGICRGFQEMNVAFGGSLHPEIRELPGRMNHRMPRLPTGEVHPDPTVVFAERHDVKLVSGGAFAQLLGQETIRVNSLHGQGILNRGDRVIIEGVADDGTIEAIRIADARGFALGVQWHAEYDAHCNPVTMRACECGLYGTVVIGQGWNIRDRWTPPVRWRITQQAVEDNRARASLREPDDDWCSVSSTRAGGWTSPCWWN
jgi:putative glutamine amidotransferase